MFFINIFKLFNVRYVCSVGQYMPSFVFLFLSLHYLIMENQLNKFLFVIPKLKSGGGNRVLLQLANKLSKIIKSKLFLYRKKKFLQN